MKRGFSPTEVLFAPTERCNLACVHCATRRSGKRLPSGAAVRFLRGCKRIGVNRVGFTGGEPFLEPGFLCRVSKAAVSEGMLFDNIITSAAWHRSGEHLRRVLGRLKENGYDGDFRVSVDAFHRQDLKKVAVFIKEAIRIWARPDIVSLTAVRGAKEAATAGRIKRLFALLKGEEFFIKILYIDLAPVGKAGRLKDPWDGRRFKEDYCKGPGNIFFVMPNGKVKPCCGYAADLDALTIGDIRRDTPSGMIERARRDRFISAIFSTGLTGVRRRLERNGVKFPGRTSSHCYFCRYLITKGYSKWLSAR